MLCSKVLIIDFNTFTFEFHMGQQKGQRIENIIFGYAPVNSRAPPPPPG